MAAISRSSRVLVHIRKACNSQPEPVEFTQSLLDALGCENDSAEIFVKLEENKLVLSDTSFQADDNVALMKRPKFCPIHHFPQEEHDKLPPEIRSRGVDCGAATILESSDGRVLLTRRAHHLRTFPGVWVPPGGHIEFGETLGEAGLRELEEETGLKITQDMCHNNTVTTLALWESVFPPKLAVGLPKRHHAVVYLHAQLKEPYTAGYLWQHLRLDPMEVGACAWVDRPLAQAIVAASDDDGVKAEADHGLPDTFRAMVVTQTHPPQEEDLPVIRLLGVAPGEGEDIERVSTGTKFALEQWLEKTKTTSNFTSKPSTAESGTFL